MAKLGDLVVRIGADTRDLNKSLGKVQRNVRSMTGNFTRLGSTITKSVTLPIVGLAAVSVKAFRDQAKAVAQVEQGLKSTGNAAGKTLGELQKMASDLQKTTLFGDEDILQNATAQLLTFTNIAGHQFDRTQKAALDLATRLDGDLKSASIQLGKALNDPVANLSALSRSGIQFSAEQKEVIKSLAETNRLAEAQTLILDELEKQYGGSAEAAAQADGGITQLGNAIGDLGEEMGKVVLDNIRPLVAGIRSIVESLSGASGTTKQFVFEVGIMAAALGPVLLLLPKIIAGITALRGAFLVLNTAMLANPALAVVAAITALTAAVVLFRNRTDDAVEANDKFIDSLQGLDKQAQINHAKEQVRLLEQERAQLAAAQRAEMAAQAVGALGDKFDKQVARGSAQRYSEQIKALDDRIADLVLRVREMHQTQDNVNVQVKEATDDTRVYSTEMDKLTTKTIDQANANKKLQQSTWNVGMMIDEVQDKTTDFGLSLTGAFASAASSAESFAETLRRITVDVVASYLRQAAAAALAKGNIPGAVALATGSGLVQRVGVPALASGGLAYGPTMAMVGDNRNAAIDPEVVAPLSKLKDMMGGGVVEVVGRIKGDDIFLSNARTARNRGRYA
jgi:hypothetical protein